MIGKVEAALHASKIISYAQGLDLMKKVGIAHEWGSESWLDCPDMAWRVYYPRTLPEPDHGGL